MLPLEVPMAMVADTVIQVGEPKLRLPASEKSWFLIFLSFVHRTMSQGAEPSSNVPKLTSPILLPKEDDLECGLRGDGESARGDNDCTEIPGWRRD